MPANDHAPVRLPLLLAGAPPGGKAGNSVSSEVMRDALERIGEVTLLSHRVALFPFWREHHVDERRHVRIGVQPLFVHGEAMLAGRMHSRRLQRWTCAWVVNSRYAGAPYAAGVPYVIWEATTVRDELSVSSWADVRRSARGSGVGFALHRSLLPVGERLEGRLYRSAAAVVAMSDYTRERIIEMHGLPPERVGVLTHPPSSTFLSVLGYSNSNRVPAVANGPWRLLFVGRVDDARKNFGLLPEVLRHLRASGRRASLTVIGAHNADWRRQLTIDDLADAITFAGPVTLPALVEAYRTHDLLLLPSRQEGFGIVVAEALAAGLPVVATRCGGPERIVRESGAGVLVPFDAAAMAAAIVDVLASDGRVATMRARAERYSQGPLHPDRFAAEVARITETVAHTSPRAPRTPRTGTAA
jgi:glycosyltransferase involved in cell wall biosynthesis